MATPVVKKGEIVATINPDGTARLQIIGNDDPGHGELLTPFEGALAGPGGSVHQHRHDHGHDAHQHVHGGKKPK